MRSSTDLLQSRLCIEELARFNANGELDPWLAEGWKTDASAKTITLTLKKGIKFHDGTDFNASSVKWSIERLISAKWGEIPAMTSIDIIDNYTLKFNLVNWDNTALIGILYYGGPQISPTAWEKSGATDAERDEWATLNPVGTGPFQFVSRERDVNQVYKKFNGYWQEGKPYLDGIKFVYIADSTVASASFSKGEVDILVFPPHSEAKELKNDGENITELTTGLGASISTLTSSSSLSDSPFANVKVRQALSHAIDKETIVDTLYYGWGVPTNQWGIPTGLWANPNLKGYPYDPAKSKQILSEAGYPDGFKTTLIVLDNTESRSLGTAVQGMLAEVGINVELDIAPSARKSKADTTAGGWNGLNLNAGRADSDLAMVLPRYAGSGGAVLARNIIHPDQVDILLSAAKQAPDQASKIAKIQELQTVLFDEYCIFTTLFVNVSLAAKKSYIHGDGLVVTQNDEWTPEDAWLSK